MKTQKHETGYSQIWVSQGKYKGKEIYTCGNTRKQSRNRFILTAKRIK